MRIAVGVIAVALAGPALAEGTADTRFGPLAVVRPATTGDMAGMGEEVRFGGAVVPDIWGAFIDIEGVWAVGPEDVVLLSVYSGGNDVCFDGKVIVAVTAAGARATEHFGYCGHQILATRADGARFELDLKVTDPRLEHLTVVYAAGAVMEVPVPRREIPAAMPGAGADVTRWEGTYPWEILQDPGERRRMQEIMPREKLFELEERVSTASEARVMNGWLIASGCMPHMCGVETGAFAIEVATGKAQAVIFHDGQPAEVFGAEASALIPLLAGFVRNGQM